MPRKPGEAYLGPWIEPEKYLESLNSCYDGICNRCNMETEVHGFVVDRWLGVQICSKCVKEINANICKL